MAKSVNVLVPFSLFYSEAVSPRAGSAGFDGQVEHGGVEGGTDLKPSGRFQSPRVAFDRSLDWTCGLGCYGERCQSVIALALDFGFVS